MDILFLKRRNLEVLDYGFCNDQFNIVIDRVIAQKSSFTINKKKLNIELGDLLVVRNKLINYIGIIESIEEKEEEHTTEVQTKDFISILDVEVKYKNYIGNVSIYLMNLIEDYYLKSSDYTQNLKYLSIARDYADISDSLEFEADQVGTISSLIQTFNKAYSMGITYSLEYTKGKISGIVLHIGKCNKGLILKSDFKGISNLVVSDSNTQATNKITFIPSDANIEHKSTVEYYLLKDGSVTVNMYSNLRITPVCCKAIIYKDDDYHTLATTAANQLLTSSLDHSITFELVMDNKVAKPFIDINVGDYIEFITDKKTYQTMVTKIQLKSNLYKAYVTLGEYRISLTEKIKLLERSRR